MLLFSLWSLMPHLQHAALSVSVSLIVFSQLLSGDLLALDKASSSFNSVLLSFLSFWRCLQSLCLCPVVSPLRAITCTSFNLYVPFSPTRFPPLHLSCCLFIRCVNNCLPTVVIAPPCQLEVRSKWQSAQFSLACALYNFYLSLSPYSKTERLVAVVCY